MLFTLLVAMGSFSQVWPEMFCTQHNSHNFDIILKPFETYSEVLQEVSLLKVENLGFSWLVPAEEPLLTHTHTPLQMKRLMSYLLTFVRLIIILENALILLASHHYSQSSKRQ